MASESVVTRALDSIALNQGFKHGHAISFESEYENLHVGLMKKVVITSNEGKTLHLVMKLPPTIANEFLLVPTSDQFFNNIHYLNKIQPILKTYGEVPTTPKLYASSLAKNEEYMIVEDLEARGFKRITPKVGLNKDELELAVSTLSSMHSSTRLWKTRNLSEFKHLTSNFKPFAGPRYAHKDRIDRYQELMKNIFEAAWIISRPVYGNKLRGSIEGILPNIMKMTEKALNENLNEPWTTLVNCNLWTNNLLFRYHSVSNKPIDVAFLDWSATRIGSPVLDLSFLAFASPSTSIYPHIDNILRRYHSEHVAKEELSTHFTVHGKFGVFGALFINVIEAFGNEMPIDEITLETLTQGEVPSENMPDIKSRILAIVNTAVDAKII